MCAAFPHTECAGYYEGMPDNLLDNLDVFYGELTPARATVYARLEGLENTDGLSLNGFVRGPRCFYSTTLLSTYPLSDAGPGPSLLAKALVTDPCYWSPETPNIYDVTVELRRGQDVIASEVRQIGFRSISIDGKNLTLDGKIWIPRGVPFDLVNEESLEHFRDTGTMVILESLNSALLQEASSQGVWAAVRVRPEEGEFSGMSFSAIVRRLSQFPAVAFAIAEPKSPDSIPPPTTPTNIRIGQYISPDRRVQSTKWGEFVVATDWLIKSQQVATHKTMPLIAAAERNIKFPFSYFRRACDTLQQEWAAERQFAGYVVMTAKDRVIKR